MKATTIFLIGIMALLLFAMPDTLQTFSSSHEYDYKECEQCHMDNINTGNVMSGMLCTDCHENQGGSHINSLPECITCHSEAQTLYDIDEPHRDIAQTASESTELIGENEACFLCHSNINAQFNFRRPQYIEFDMSRQDRNWIIQNLTAGPVTSHLISVDRSTRSHQWISGLEILCTSCHLDIAENFSAHYPSSTHPTGEQCLYCHMKSSSQHAAQTVLCVGNCHTDHNGNLISQISGQPPQFQSNICIGCHNENPASKKPPSNMTISHFKVYLEPIYKVERTS